MKQTTSNSYKYTGQSEHLLETTNSCGELVWAFWPPVNSSRLSVFGAPAARFMRSWFHGFVCLVFRVSRRDSGFQFSFFDDFL
jgi:hypothetical protein